MILYDGPSMLDGAPIIVVATINSKNPKADMVQTWILRKDMSPREASALKLDSSVCGGCMHRHSLGGACYVQLWQAPRQVYASYLAGNYDKPGNIRAVSRALATQEIRLGSYGDPAAVPFHVWESLLAQSCGGWTGYTHQWRTCDPEFAGIVMASCDSPEDVKLARSMGYRAFYVRPEGAISKNVDKVADVALITCRAKVDDNVTCSTCLACDGTRAGSKALTAASVQIEVHGNMRKKFALPVVQ